MPGMNLAAVDTNLLIVLDALLSEGGVSKAAVKLGSTQPSVSRALARLRSWFGDPLLVRTRGGMAPTVKARGMQGEVRELAERMRRVFADASTFDPATSTRVFRVMTSEYSLLVLFPPLLARWAGKTGVGIDIAPWRLAFVDDLESNAADIAIAPSIRPIRGLRSARLLVDDFVVVARPRHRELRANQKLTLAAYAGLDHVGISPNGRAGGVVDDALTAHEMSRRIVIRVPTFGAAAAVVRSTSCVATMPRRVMRSLADASDFVVVAPPLPLPGFALELYWHEHASRDAGIDWLRAELLAVAESLEHVVVPHVSYLDVTRRATGSL
jgi:DNA-binding transcriptional LysR family regulator